MSFVRRKHEYSDGPGRVRGAAYSPDCGGDIFFDDEENWCLESYNYRYLRKANLMVVATHELGHALGLNHSDKVTALMTSKGTNNLVGDVKLYNDDVQAIQALYGASNLARPQIEDIEEIDVETGNRR